jgi:hypothetical protein
VEERSGVARGDRATADEPVRWLARDQRDWAAAGRWLTEAARNYELAGAVADARSARAELASF